MCTINDDSIVLQVSIRMRISRFLLIILIVSLSGTGLLFYISYSKNTSFSLLRVTSTLKQGIYGIVHVSVFSHIAMHILMFNSYCAVFVIRLYLMYCTRFNILSQAQCDFDLL